MPKAGMDHFVLNVANIDRILAFYENVLGLHPERVEEFRAGKISLRSVIFFPKKYRHTRMMNSRII